MKCMLHVKQTDVESNLLILKVNEHHRWKLDDLVPCVKYYPNMQAQ